MKITLSNANLNIKIPKKDVTDFAIELDNLTTVKPVETPIVDEVRTTLVALIEAND